MKKQLKLKLQNEQLRTYYDLRKPVCSCGACGGICICGCTEQTVLASNNSRSSSATIQSAAMSETEARY